MGTKRDINYFGNFTAVLLLVGEWKLGSSPIHGRDAPVNTDPGLNSATLAAE